MTTEQIPIKIEKINSSTLQLTKISSTLLTKISEKFSWLPPGYRFQPKFRLLGIKGVTVKLVQGNGMFPTGLLSDIVEYITDELNREVILSNAVIEHFKSLTVDIEGGISADVFSNFKMDDTEIKLRDYQTNAVEAAFENRNCLLNLSTGSGKCLGPDTLLKIRIPDNIAEKYKHLIEKE